MSLKPQASQVGRGLAVTGAALIRCVTSSVSSDGHFLSSSLPFLETGK